MLIFGRNVALEYLNSDKKINNIFIADSFNDRDILDLINKNFSAKLTEEEMMIIRQYMISEWIGYQLANIDLVKQKYSGSDFKFTSQASHIKQLVTLKKEYETKGFHLQRLYNRRKKLRTGGYGSTFARVMDVSDKHYYD